ncbi:MAG: hypothetical protein U0900_23120 [Myxococcota bacterium]
MCGFAPAALLSSKPSSAESQVIRDPLCGMMRQLILLISVLVLCRAVAAATAPVDSTRLQISAGRNIVQYFRLHFGSVEDCPSCVLLEWQENAIRNAYFVEPQATCQLERSDVQALSVQERGTQISIEVRLKASGILQLKKCNEVGDSSDPSQTPLFLIYANGSPVGTEFIMQSERDNSFYLLVGDKSLRPIAESLGWKFDPNR